MAYLLVHTGDTSEAQNYGMALGMDKSPSSSDIHNGGGSRDTVCLHLQWTQLVICSYTAIQGLQPYSPPKGQAFRHPPPGKAEESPYGQISQLEVHQLLSAGPQVIYPVGLNGSNQPVTITLPELLHSGSSFTTDEHPHMRIDMPLLPPEEPECTTPPLGEAHSTPAATSPKTPLKPRISIGTEVDDLLTQAMADKSSHKSEHSTTGNAATAEAVMSPSHKSEAPPLPVDTSSQASLEEGEASLGE